MPSRTVTEPKNNKNKKSSKKDYIFAVGRRREAVARVRLYEPSRGTVSLNNNQYHKGDILVNQKAFGQYFQYFGYAPYFKKFFDVTGASDKFFFSVKVAGGGKKGQLEAVILGMARVLDKFNREAYHRILRQGGYLTRDARTRERRKVGTGGKARRKKQSPKR